MKVSEREYGLWFGDVIITKADIESIVTWVRIEDRDGPRDENDPHDFDVILMDNNGEVIHVKDIRDLDDCEYSHNTFKRGE